MSNPTPDDGSVPPQPPQPPAGSVPPPQDFTAPQPGEPQQPGGPNKILTGLSDQVGIITRLAKNQTLEAFQIASRSPLLWVVTLVIGALLTGALLATTLGRASGVAVSSIASAFGGGTVYFGMTAGAWFSVLFTTIIVLAIVVALRAVALHLTFQTGGKPQSFRESLSVVATAYSLHLPVMAVMLLLVLIPGRSWLMIVGILGMFLWGLLTLVAELLIYVGLNRTTGFVKSPFRNHIIATAIWMIAVAIVYFLVSLIMGDLATGSLGGML